MKKLLYLLLVSLAVVSLQGGNAGPTDWKGRNDEEAMAEYAEWVMWYSKFKAIESQLALKKAQEEKEKNDSVRVKESELYAKKAADEAKNAAEYGKEIAEDLAKKDASDKTKQQAFEAKKIFEEAQKAVQDVVKAAVQSVKSIN